MVTIKQVDTIWDLSITDKIPKLQISEKYCLKSDNNIFKIWLKGAWMMLEQYFWTLMMLEWYFSVSSLLKLFHKILNISW